MKRAAFALQANRARLTERFLKKEKAQPEEEDEPVEEYDPVRNPACVLEPHEVRARDFSASRGSAPLFTPYLLSRPSGLPHAAAARPAARRPQRVGARARDV